MHVLFDAAISAKVQDAAVPSALTYSGIIFVAPFGHSDIANAGNSYQLTVLCSFTYTTETKVYGRKTRKEHEQITLNYLFTVQYLQNLHYWRNAISWNSLLSLV